MDNGACGKRKGAQIPSLSIQITRLMVLGPWSGLGVKQAPSGESLVYGAVYHLYGEGADGDLSVRCRDLGRWVCHSMDHDKDKYIESSLIPFHRCHKSLGSS